MTSQPPAPAADSSVEGLPNFAHRYLEVEGVRLHYVVGGAGPLVVLVHGFPYTWALWRELMPLLADAGYTVIAPDLRGLGDSAKVEAGYDKVTVAKDIRAIVKSLGFATINLVGTDIGTMVAYAYASRYPDEVEHLILAESLIPGFGLEELMNPATGGYWHFGFHGQVEVAAMLAEGKEATYLTPWYGMMSAAPDAVGRAQAHFLPYYTAPGGIRAGFQHYGTMIADGQANREAFSGKMTMPVLVLSGERGIPQAQTLACVEQVAVSIETDIVPGAGHTFASDNPAWTAERMDAFFKEATR